MKKYWGHIYFFVVFIFCSSHLFGQNLVPNPSFESVSSPPTSYGQIGNALNWTSAYGSADLFHTSATSGTVGIPSNYFGTQAARTGNTYAGVASSSTNSYHEYIKVPLISPLVIGQSYYVEAYVSAGEGPYRYGIDNFGFVFTTSPLAGIAANPPLSNTPQVNWTSPITDVTNWVQISGTFTATTAATWLTLGNFYHTASTSWVPLGSGSINSQFWFIEDVLVQVNSVLEYSPDFFEVKIQNENQVQINWAVNGTENFSSFVLERSSDEGNSFEEIAIQKGKNAGEEVEKFSFRDQPEIFGIELVYRIRFIREDGSAETSPIKSVILPVPELGKTLKVFPEPVQNGQDCNISFITNMDGIVSVELMDLNGKIVWTEKFEHNSGKVLLEIPTHGLNSGIYFLSVKSGNQLGRRKIQINR